MFQVDAFWSYGIGAGYALAGTNQLAVADGDIGRRATVRNRQIALTVLFLGVLFLPIALLLATRFPRWETMYALTEIPPWAMACFGAGVFVSGALGCLLTLRLLARGALWAACLQVIGAYAGVFFILVHGWDGSGLHRLLASAPSAFPAGPPTVAELLRFCGSPVAATLCWMGAVILPVLLFSYVWCHAYRPPVGGPTSRLPGARDFHRWRPSARVVLGVAVVVLGTCPLLAVAASVSVRALGGPVGGALVMALGTAILRPHGPLARHCRSLVRPHAPHERSPAVAE
ncbi:hypothetical protein [Streptomyces sp. GS7]|uniref:hypothetical protein n=1 Tax=Streptomyces sp. GS7 TaxID=2692234 RepID=UPI0013191880|nr:hypothetical protein [Streptomyces sp. GS7]QHC21485.1 hypothetical protein GR130_08700 [Streptomyces sp. GS7]